MTINQKEKVAKLLGYTVKENAEMPVYYGGDRSADHIQVTTITDTKGETTDIRFYTFDCDEVTEALIKLI